MTRRLLQAMAGAPHGGAETFFVRLAGALQRAGETQRVVIRRCPDRSQALRKAGVAVTELRFGGPFDIASRTAFGRHVYAVGGHAEAARRAGIKVQSVRVGVFMLSLNFSPLVRAPLYRQVYVAGFPVMFTLMVLMRFGL